MSTSSRSSSLVSLMALPLLLGLSTGARAQGRGAAGAEPNPSRLSQPVSTWSPDRTIRTFPSNPALGASYPRIIQLQHYEPGKGQLLASFSRRGGPMPIFRSTDNGETFEFFSEVTGLRGSPALYELPRQMGEFPAGTILAAGSVADLPDPTKRALGVSYSSDGGKTWQFLSTYAETTAGGRYGPEVRAGLRQTQAPIYEPYLYSDAEGRLVVYFSDERYKAGGTHPPEPGSYGYNQLLDHRVSEDGGRTWGDVVFDVAIPDGLTRPGMAVVTRTGNGRFFMVYEMVSMPGYPLEPRSNPVHFKVSDDGVDWGDFKEFGTLIQDRWRQYINGTPYIVWSPWGGPNGTLIASGRSIVRYDLGRVGNGVMINRNNGEGFWTLIETPIRYTPGPGGYSQTMIPLGDGREILQLVPVDGQLQYAKFELPDTLPEYDFPFGPKR